jgi:chemotaxis protein methyltransferase CheR
VSALLDTGDVERFRVALGRCLGWQFEDQKLGQLHDVLQRRLERVKEPTDAYLSELHRPSGKAECAMLARELTVGETYFFRNIEQFHALAEVGLPDRMRTNWSTRRLRLLSAGCASGEEAYSLAIVLRETAAAQGWDTLVRAVDINPATLEKAARGRYSAWALRETPAAMRDRWFCASGRDLLLDSTIKSAVCFDQRNLAVDDAELWQPGTLDFVFCRNVIMYFTPQQARALVARVAQALRPGGYLFLGHAETLRGLSEAFHLRHSHGTFYYQRREEAEARSAAAARDREQPAADSAEIAGRDAWIQLIHNATERVAALTSAPTRRRSGKGHSPVVDLGDVLDLVRRERFTEALKLLRGRSREVSRDPNLQLLEAMLLANIGQLTDAEQACRRLLEFDELNAGAHYILALCCENAGNLTDAAEHDRVAAYLDPTFAMPRLHLGLLHRRAGDRADAQRELAQASTLLRREDVGRLLLFGGGFNREALLAMCASTPRDCEVRA